VSVTLVTFDKQSNARRTAVKYRSRCKHRISCYSGLAFSVDFGVVTNPIESDETLR